MLVPVFVDAGVFQNDLALLAVCNRATLVADFKAVAGQDREIALFQVADFIRERRERDGIGAYEHLAVAMTHRQGGALARRDHQILLAFKQEGEGKRPIKLLDGFVGRINGGFPVGNQRLAQEGDSFRVGFGGKGDALAAQIRAQILEVFDDAIVNNSNTARAVGVGVAHGRGPVGGPTGVTDAGFSSQRFMHQKIR